MTQKPNAVKATITNLIRLILILTFIYTISTPHPLVQAVSLIALATTFIPTILEKIFKIKIPAAFEVLHLMFIYGLLILGEARGLYHGLIWWEILMTLTASIALGFTALSVIHVLHKTKRINTNPILAALLVFSISLSLATVWELFEFALDTIIGSGLQKSLTDTMTDLSISSLGSILMGLVGYVHMKNNSSTFTSQFITKLVEKSPIILGPKRPPEDPKSIAEEILRIGETPKIEFKSTIRTNLHTNEFDKKMEYSILKTITAFLNTSGGSLLIGVSDDKKILGLEKDNFSSKDKISLHLTNLIKTHIGNELLPFIKTTIVRLEEKEVVLILCKTSPKRVFLKSSGLEEFYVRNGPSSVKLEGSSLIDYISYKFKKE